LGLEPEIFGHSCQATNGAIYVNVPHTSNVPEASLIEVEEINRKFRVPRKQGAHFLGAQAEIQDSWVFSFSV
jgi:hypothetical protein